jgi:hypothetical protein
MARTSNAVKNTKEIINRYRGKNSEFYMLKGLLVACHEMSYKDQEKFQKLVDTMLIAKRMDEIIKELTVESVKNVA